MSNLKTRIRTVGYGAVTVALEQENTTYAQGLLSCFPVGLLSWFNNNIPMVWGLEEVMYHDLTPTL